jgi:hypothetical protein
VTDRKKMEGSCSTGQSPQWAVVPVEEVVLYTYIVSVCPCSYLSYLACKAHALYLLSVACLTLPYFSTSSHTDGGGGGVLGVECVF